MPAEYVRPFVKSNKNDYVDAEAIAEAVQRPGSSQSNTRHSWTFRLYTVYAIGGSVGEPS